MELTAVPPEPANRLLDAVQGDLNKKKQSYIFKKNVRKQFKFMRWEFVSFIHLVSIRITNLKIQVPEYTADYTFKLDF